MKIQDNRETVFLPLEITSREYWGKLLLASFLIDEGFSVVFGHKAYVSDFARRFPERGFYLNKSVGATNNSGLYKLFRSRDIRILAQDEEHGGTFYRYEDFYKRRKGLSDLEMLDGFFCWGLHDYDFLNKEFANFGEKLKLTGSPRTSFWGDSGRLLLDREITKVKQVYQDYILIASNLVIGNSPISLEMLTNQRKKFNIHSSNVEYDLNLRYKSESVLMQRYVKLIRLLDRKNREKIVVRPHPTENADSWSDILKGTKNVYLDTNTNISTLILGSSAVIHNNSTVGLESLAGGVPTFALSVDEDEIDPKITFPNSISRQIFSVEDADGIFEMPLTHAEDTNHKDLINMRFQDFGTLLPVNRIVNQIKQLSLTSNSYPNPKGQVNLFRRNVLENQLIRSWRIPKLVRHKQKPFTKDQIENDLKNIRTSLGGVKSYAIKRVHAFTYRIETCSKGSKICV